MNIAVCVKPVPDISIVSIDPDIEGLDSNDFVNVINPYDMIALEEAVRIKEKNRDCLVTVVSIAPPETERLLHRCLAAGADRAMRIWDLDFERLDSHAAGRLLAGVIGTLPFDLILCGLKAADTEAGLAGAVIAASLGLPIVRRVDRIVVLPEGRQLSVDSILEGAKRARIEIDLPAVVTVAADLNTPRYPSLPDVTAGLRKKVESLDATALGISFKLSGSESPNTRTIDVAAPKPRPKKVFTPDSCLSADERLRLILDGGVTKKKGDRLEGNPGQIADTVIQFFKENHFILPGN